MRCDPQIHPCTAGKVLFLAECSCSGAEVSLLAVVASRRKDVVVTWKCPAPTPDGVSAGVGDHIDEQGGAGGADEDDRCIVAVGGMCRLIVRCYGSVHGTLQNMFGERSLHNAENMSKKWRIVETYAEIRRKRTVPLAGRKVLAKVVARLNESPQGTPVGSMSVGRQRRCDSLLVCGIYVAAAEGALSSSSSHMVDDAINIKGLTYAVDKLGIPTFLEAYVCDHLSIYIEYPPEFWNHFLAVITKLAHNNAKLQIISIRVTSCVVTPLISSQEAHKKFAATVKLKRKNHEFDLGIGEASKGSGEVTNRVSTDSGCSQLNWANIFTGEAFE
uniref:Uncharacterized protein n=1 Tax=Setaria digitata TaxID=48799 RepID=A0A915Q655_9BILA